MHHFFTVFLFLYSPENSSNDGMLPAPASSRRAAWVMVNRHHKKASQIAVKPFCMEKNIPHQAFRPAPHFTPGRYALCFPFSSALKRSSLLSIPSLLLHGWAPAGFLRGLRRCCFYRDSHGEGEEVSGKGASIAMKEYNRR